MPRLPRPGSDQGTWGDVLNEYLSVEHQDNGSLKNVARPDEVAAKADQSSLDSLAAAVYSKSEVDALTAQLQSTIDQKSDKPQDYLTPVAMFSPNLSRTGAGLINPTRTGAVWEATLDGAAAWKLVEGTTNLFSNPYANGSWGYSSMQAGGGTAKALANPNPHAVLGVAAIEATVDLPGTYFGVRGMAVISTTAGAKTYSVQGVGTASTNYSMVVVARYTDASEELFSETAIQPPGVAYTYKATFTSNAAKTVQQVELRVQKKGATPAANDTAAITLIQIEEKPYTTPLCPAKNASGDLLPGQQWNGTVDASTSTRIGGNILASVPTGLTPLSGSVYVATTAPTFTRGSRMLVAIGEYAGSTGRQEFFVRRDNNTQVLMYQKSNPPGIYQTVIDTVAAGASLRQYNAWDNTKLYSRGQSLPRDTPQAVWGTNTIGIAGRGPYNNENWQDPVAVIIFYDRPLTSGELARLDATPTYRLGWETLNPALMTTPFADLLPNKKTASSSVLRLTPGSSGIEVTTLPSHYAVHDTGQRLAISAVVYALVWTLYGQGWVDETALGQL